MFLDVVSIFPMEKMVLYRLPKGKKNIEEKYTVFVSYFRVYFRRSLKGMVVVKAKRPSLKDSDKAAFVTIDDFDSNNTELIEGTSDELQTIETNLSSLTDVDFSNENIEEKEDKAIELINRVREQAKDADTKAFALSIEAKQTVARADELLAKINLKFDLIETKPLSEIEKIIYGTTSLPSVDIDRAPSSSPTSVNGIGNNFNAQNCEEGVEVNSYNHSNFAVEEKKRKVNEIRENLFDLKEVVNDALKEFRSAEKEHNQAQNGK